jgi:hypothetical protein
LGPLRPQLVAGLDSGDHRVQHAQNQIDLVRLEQPVIAGFHERDSRTIPAAATTGSMPVLC